MAYTDLIKAIERVEKAEAELRLARMELNNEMEPDLIVDLFRSGVLRLDRKALRRMFPR